MNLEKQVRKEIKDMQVRILGSIERSDQLRTELHVTETAIAQQRGAMYALEKVLKQITASEKSSHARYPHRP